VNLTEKRLIIFLRTNNMGTTTMQRNITIDFIRGFCMMYIVGIFHMTQYLGEYYYLNNNIYGNSFMCSCLGTFSFISGYLIGTKYICNNISDAFVFYRKRIVRFYPLFVVSSILLYLISFNDLQQTVNGLFGLSSFEKKGTLTLWYISMIMVFYLITPIILKEKKVRIIRSFFVFIGFCILSQIIFIDKRFIFNLFLYLSGICLSLKDIDFFRRVINTRLKRFFVGMGLLLYFILFFNLGTLNSFIIRKIIECLGVYVIVILAFFCLKQVGNSKLVYFFSYISMACYLFHRFTYWLALQIYQPDEIIFKLLYLVFIALPFGILFSYTIQKSYDLLLYKLNK